MYTHVLFEFFRCFQGFSVPLKPLTVLIGPNDTGKSAFFQGILKATKQIELDGFDFWRYLFNNKAKLFLSSPDIGIDGKYPPKGVKSIGGAITTSLFRLDSAGISFQSPGQDDQQGIVSLDSKGGNVPTLLDYFLRKDRKRFDQIVSRMRELVPGLSDINIATPGGMNRRIDLVIENQLQVVENNVSAGVKLLLFFVALAHHPQPPKLILIEEPETGIHPHRLKIIVDLLKKVTQGAFGGMAAQVILTTHSPYLLDFIDPTVDQVLVFQRQPDGNCLPQAVDEEKLKNSLTGFGLGEIWSNDGEMALVKGLPG